MSRNHALDGLRGLAALAVAGGHSILAVTGLSVWGLTVFDFDSHPLHETFERLGYLIFPSDAAVMLFFTLSGHVLWEAFSKKYDKSIIEFPDYVVSRAYRLLPTSIAVGVLFGLASGHYIADISNIELIRTMFILSRETNGVLWSLQTEVVCSLMLFLAWLLVRGTGIGALLCLIGSIIAFQYYPDGYVLCSAAFFVGALVRYAPGFLRSSSALAITGLVLMVSSSVYYGHDWHSRYFEMTGAFLIIAYARNGHSSFLVSRPVQFLGHVSYPFYLVHPLALALARPLVAHLAGEPAAAQILAYFLVSTSIALPASWVLHVAVEKPSMLGRPKADLAKWFTPKTSDSAQSHQLAIVPELVSG